MRPQHLDCGLQVHPPVADVGSQPEVADLVHDAGNSLAKGRGTHQFQSPSRRINAGTYNARTMVASISTAIATPKPSCLTKMISAVTKQPIAITINKAANVTIRPVRWSPRATASSLEAPPSCSSLI